MPDSPANGRQPGSGDPLAVIRGIGGAVIGFGVFTLLATYFGLYAIALPGALVGLICGYCTQRRSPVLGIVCAGIAAATMILAEWWNFPLIKDKSLGFFLQNLRDLHALFWLSLLLGGGLAFWLGMGNERTTPHGAS